MPNDNKSGTVIQRTWWRIRDLYHELKPCRFSVIVALIALPVFVRVAQGTEILRTVGEGMAGGQWYWPRVCGFFAALILWSISSWYAARVLLYLDFPGVPAAQSRSKFAETHVPRVLGIAPILIVGLGLFAASRSYASTEKTRSWLVGFAAFCVLLAVIFYTLLVYRRRIFDLTTSVRVKHVSHLEQGTFIGVGTIALI